MLAIAANGMAIQKPIEEIQVGDRVLSYNEETGQNQVKTVSQTFTSSHEKVVKVRQSNGQVITSSYGHPYYTKRGWIAAENLKAGDILQTVNGETVVVEFVEHVLLESSVTLYNFEVDGNHNYYVADSVHADTSEFVLVHNKGCNNPNGKKGGVVHRKELNAKKLELEAKGYNVEAEKYFSMYDSIKRGRFADLYAKDFQGNEYIYQIGRVKPTGFPIGRETLAIRDFIKEYGNLIIEFIPYN